MQVQNCERPLRQRKGKPRLRVRGLPGGDGRLHRRFPRGRAAQARQPRPQRVGVHWDERRYSVFDEVYDPYWDAERQAWVFETDTDWAFEFKEGFIVSRRYDGNVERIGKEVYSFEAAENIVRNDWDTFYL